MDYLKFAIILAVVLIVFLLYKLYTKFHVLRFLNNNKISLVGKTIIVTGANTGIGYETALEFAKRGAKIILACRDEARGTKAAETIKRLTRNKNVILKVVDLASFNSVRRFVEDIKSTEDALDILVNNAGTMLLGDHLTEDGLQLEMQINYISPVLVTLLLLDLLKKSPSSRIINVSSILAKYAKNFTPETMNVYTGHSDTYSNSKLGNILFTQKLAAKLEGTNISIFSVHPGIISTDLFYRHLYSFFGPLGKFIADILFRGPAEGCQTTLYTALEQGIEHLTGSHFENGKVVGTYSNAKDLVKSTQIWDATMKIIKFDDSKIKV